jgi:hypothetical protein
LEVVERVKRQNRINSISVTWSGMFGEHRMGGDGGKFGLDGVSPHHKTRLKAKGRNGKSRGPGAKVRWIIFEPERLAGGGGKNRLFRVLNLFSAVYPQDWSSYPQDWSLYSQDRLHFTTDGANFGGEKRVILVKSAC